MSGTSSASQEEYHYYGQRDELGHPHGMGACLTPAGAVHSRQCGRWEHGAFKEIDWVWRGYLLGAPLTARAAAADALGQLDDTYVGAISGPLHMPNGLGKTYRASGALQSEGSFADGLLEGRGSWYGTDGQSYCGNYSEGESHSIGRAE